MEIAAWEEGAVGRSTLVRIDDSDLWSLPEVLALVIAPALRKLREVQCGSSFVEDEDVPPRLRSGRVGEPDAWAAPDDNWAPRWHWILDEMIWTFEQLAQPDLRRQYYSGQIDIQWEPIPNSDMQKMRLGPEHTLNFDEVDRYDARVSNGLRLFARYYRCLWE